MSVIPGRLLTTIYKRTTYTRVFTYEDASGAPINLTGFTATFTAKADEASTTNIIALTVGSGVVIDGVNGTITITISAAQTALIQNDKLIYCLMVSNSTSVLPLLIGDMIVSEETF